MTWVDLPSARANADQPLDAGTAKAVQARLTQLYTQSIYDICCPSSDVSDPIMGVTSTSTWAWIGNPLPLLARPLAGGDPRQITIEAELKGHVADAWELRAYLLPSSGRPTIDATECVLGVTSYCTLQCASTTYVEDSGTVTTLGPMGALVGDGTIPGLSVPVYWLHLAHTGEAVVTISVRALRFREVIP